MNPFVISDNNYHSKKYFFPNIKKIKAFIMQSVLQLMKALSNQSVYQ